MTDRALDRAALSPTQFSAELVIVHVLGNVSRWTFRIWMHPCLPGRPMSTWRWNRARNRAGSRPFRSVHGGHKHHPHCRIDAGQQSLRHLLLLVMAIIRPHTSGTSSRRISNRRLRRRKRTWARPPSPLPINVLPVLGGPAFVASLPYSS